MHPTSCRAGDAGPGWDLANRDEAVFDFTAWQHLLEEGRVRLQHVDQLLVVREVHLHTVYVLWCRTCGGAVTCSIVQLNDSFMRLVPLVTRCLRNALSL